MTKVSIEGTDSPIKKRAPRKRVVRRVVSSDEKPARRVRTTGVFAATSTSRKAPSRIEYSERKNTNLKSVWVGVVILAFVFAGAAWVGISDQGQINVNAKINERNQKMSDEATDVANQGEGEDVPRTIVVPVQNTAPSVPNGGFRGRGVKSPDASLPTSQSLAEEESASSTASSSEAIDSEEQNNEEVNSVAEESNPDTVDEDIVPELTQ